MEQNGAYSSVPSEIELDTMPSRASMKTRERPRRRTMKGWRNGILSGAMAATLVLVINLSLTIWSDINGHQKNDSGRKVLFEGDCKQAARINAGLHLLLNVLSTIPLSASNYAMQCLSAPTRKEVDAAHQKRQWLDIGVLSIRNLSSINPRRVLLWAFLVVTSLPLHLL